ncbi:MAG TPA: hypothetical protein VGL22_07385 [Terracidiphilus sp.]
MKQIGKWMLGAAVVAGTLGLGSTAAHAQVGVGVYVGGGPAAYVPPCPGPGYEWTAGYYSGGYWVPGRWAYAGANYYGNGYGYRVYQRDRDWDRDRNWDRGRDRDRGRGREQEHFRGDDRGGRRGGDRDRR